MRKVRKVSGEVIKEALFPLVLLLVIIAGYIFYRIKLVLFFPPAVEQSLRKYIMTVFVLCLAFFLQRIGEGLLCWYKKNIAARTLTQLDDEFIPLLQRTLRVFIWIIALLVILPFYGVNITALVAALGVSSLAIALAAQDTIANIIAGFLIMIDRPFRLGDKIKLPTGEIVKVLNIGVRRSTFAAEEKAIIIVPNADLSKNKIVNYTYGEEQLS